LQKGLETVNLPRYSMQDLLNLKIGDLLLDLGYLNTEGFSTEQVKEQVTFLNQLTSPVDE
jgi:hypothetical protein